jgi:hypothetical protein
LPLAEWVIGRRLEDARAVLYRMHVVPVYVFHPHVHGVAHRVRRAGCARCLMRAAVRHDDRAIAEDELRAMGADAQAHPEAEDVAEPAARLLHVFIGEHRDYRCRWH